MTVLIANRTEIVLPRDALVEVRTPAGELIGVYKLEPCDPDKSPGESVRPPDHPSAGQPAGAESPG